MAAIYASSFHFYPFPTLDSLKLWWILQRRSWLGHQARQHRQHFQAKWRQSLLSVPSSSLLANSSVQWTRWLFSRMTSIACRQPWLSFRALLTHLKLYSVYRGHIKWIEP